MFVPNYYSEFACIGGRCQATCCAIWRIQLDAETLAYYESLEGEFGSYVRKNLLPYGDTMRIDMNGPDMKCPFIDERGLCRVYKECGEEHMSEVCREFPRLTVKGGGFELRTLSLTCEEVMRILCEREGPVSLYEDGDTVREELPAAPAFVLWAMEYLQKEDIPLGMRLGAVSYLALSYADMILEGNAGDVAFVTEQAPDVLEEFRRYKKAVKETERQKITENVVFTVMEVFSKGILEGDSIWARDLGWDETMWQRPQEERRKLLYRLWRDGKAGEEFMQFAGRAGAAYLSIHAAVPSDRNQWKEIFLRNFCNYMLLFRILPPVWSVSHGEVLSRLARLGRVMEHARYLSHGVWPEVQRVLDPDALTYAIVFMELYGC